MPNIICSIQNLAHLVERAVAAFKLDLTGKTVLTEAATGDFAATASIAAAAGANVLAIARSSRHGSQEDAAIQTSRLASALGVNGRITTYHDMGNIDFGMLDIVTNTGFVRPIDRSMIAKLRPGTVIPLMWEPWELRPSDVDIDACVEYGCKVYGTNESDHRLRTMEYIGFIALRKLLENKRSPLSTNIVVVAEEPFLSPIISVLRSVGYQCMVASRDCKITLNPFTAIVIADHVSGELKIGPNGALINSQSLSPTNLIVHIAGNVDVREIVCTVVPNSPAVFGQMSFTTA